MGLGGHFKAASFQPSKPQGRFFGQSSDRRLWRYHPGGNTGLKSRCNTDSGEARTISLSSRHAAEWFRFSPEAVNGELRVSDEVLMS
jgi:hypothetical protein